MLFIRIQFGNWLKKSDRKKNPLGISPTHLITELLIFSEKGEQPRIKGYHYKFLDLMLAFNTLLFSKYGEEF
jgi:hypothetical protein